MTRLHARVALGALLGGLASAMTATAAASPPVLAAPGQVVPLPPPGTPSAMPLPAYDTDADPRNEWSKREFPQHGECRWLPTPWGDKPGPGPAVTAAERAAIRREIERVIAALKTAPVVNPPVGFCPMVVSAGPDDGVDLGFALRFSFMVANRRANDHVRDKPGGPLRVGELLHLIFRFNEWPGAEGAAFAATDAQGAFHAEPVPVAMFQGFPVIRTGSGAEQVRLVVPVNDRPLHRPVQLARVIRWQLGAFDQAIREAQAQVDSARREYDAFFTPAAQAEEETIIARRIEAQRARTPELQARIRASRQAEVEAKTAQLRRRWDVAADPNHPLAVARQRREQAQARLEGLSAAEAQSPACLVRLEPAHVTPDVAVAGDARCTLALVERNPDYYDRSRPRSVIQVLTIDRFPLQPPAGGLPGSRHRNVWANQHMVWGLDWQQIRREVLPGAGPR